MTSANECGDVEVLFELVLEIPPGEIYEAYASYIKDNLYQLGIDLTILVKPFGDYLGEKGGDYIIPEPPQPFDIAMVRFSQPSPTPDFVWNYYSGNDLSSFYYGPLYPLNDPDWKAFQEADMGIKTSDIDQLVLNISMELDPLVKRKQINQFSELFMSKLLYDFPLTTTSHLTYSWLGYGDDNNPNTFTVDINGNKNHQNDLWSPQEGIVQSEKLGAKWNMESTPPGRGQQLDQKTRNTTLQLRTKSEFREINPYKISVGEQKYISQISDTLLSFDQDYNPHPNLAYNFVAENWDRNGDVTDIIENGKLTFFINADYNNDSEGDWKFSNTTDIYGQQIASHPVDAKDFALALDYLDYWNWTRKDRGIYQGSSIDIDHWEINRTVRDTDTLIIYMNRPGLNNLYALNTIHPLPEHILNQTLHFGDDYSEVAFTSREPDWSMEWEHYFSQEGYASLGSMRIDQIQRGETYQFIAREAYPFPNEWDAEVMYENHRDQFDDYLHQELLNSTRITSLSYFAPHLFDHPPSAYYWSYEGDNQTRIKPQIRGVDHLIYRRIDDDQNALDAFQLGLLDSITISDQSANQQLVEKNSFVSKPVELPYSPILLVFNLLNEQLQKRDIRYAIASAIDKSELEKIGDGFETLHDAPVWRFSDVGTPDEFLVSDGKDLTWYTDAYRIPYDLQTARDLLRTDGYGILPEPCTSTQVPIQTTTSVPKNVEKPTSKETNEKPSIASYPIPLTLTILLPILVRYSRYRKKTL